MEPREQAHVGIVRHVVPGKALVRIAEQASCQQCGHEKGCGIGRHAGKELWVIDRIGVQPGTRVEIDISSEGLLTASFVLYGLPLAALLLGAIVGQLVRGETGSAVGAGIGLLLAFPVVRFFANRIPEKKRFVAYVKAVLHDEPISSQLPTMNTQDLPSLHQ